MPLVYIMQNGTEYKFKIGRTKAKAETRKRSLSTGNPNLLTIFDTIETEHAKECEGYLHKVLSSKRIAGIQAHEFFAIDPDELRRMIKKAREYVAELSVAMPEAKRLAKIQSDGTLKKAGNADLDAYHQIKMLREVEDRAKLERELLEYQLQISIGGCAGIEGVANWETIGSTVFDQAAFSLAHPDLYQAFTKSRSSRRFRLE